MGVTGSTSVFPALTQSWKKLLAQEQRNSFICLWKCEQGWDLFVPHKAACVPLWWCHFLFDMDSQIMPYLGHQIMWPFYLSVLVPSLSHSPKDLMLFTNTPVLSHCVGFQFVANLICLFQHCQLFCIALGQAHHWSSSCEWTCDVYVNASIVNGGTVG